MIPTDGNPKGLSKALISNFVSPLAGLAAELEADWAASPPRDSEPITRARTEDEFWAYTRTEFGLFGCWAWDGSFDRHGYGRIVYKGRSWRAHRLAYTLARGPIGDGLTIDHLCHTLEASCKGGPECPHRGCVNPAHLDPCTQWENVQRGFWGLPK